MIIFCFDSYKDLAKDIFKSNHTFKSFSVNRFPNQELFIDIKADIQNKECLIIGSITPPDENLFTTLVLADTLKKEGAKKVVLLAPYLAYTRQDKPKKGESMATKLIGSILKTSGIDKVITVDVHSHHTIKLFPISLKSISSAPILADEIKKISWEDATLFAPDEGSLKRYRAIKKLANMTHPVAYLKKVRNHNGIVHQDIIGNVSKRIIVVDDMLDTGGTLVSCCQILKERGAEEIIIMVTHGLFTKEKWKKLWDLGVKRIYSTNTTTQKFQDKRIYQLDISPLIKI